MTADVGANQAAGTAQVRISNTVVEAMEALPRPQRAAVGAAIERIGQEAGKRLKITPPGSGKGNYLAMTPDDNKAPVVIYRKLMPFEDGDFLVTGLADRASYAEYEKADEQGLLDSTVGKLFIGAAIAVAVGLASRSRAHRGEATPSPKQRSADERAGRHEIPQTSPVSER
jgi:hypothetical protein